MAGFFAWFVGVFQGRIFRREADFSVFNKDDSYTYHYHQSPSRESYSDSPDIISDFFTFFYTSHPYTNILFHFCTSLPNTNCLFDCYGIFAGSDKYPCPDQSAFRAKTYAGPADLYPCPADLYPCPAHPCRNPLQQVFLLAFEPWFCAARRYDGTTGNCIE